MRDRDLAARLMLRANAVVVAALLLAPILIVIPLSFTGQRSFKFPPDTWSMQWYQNFFTNPEWTSSLQTSLVVASIVTVISVVIGTLAAVGLDRLRQRVVSQALRQFTLTPLIVPGIVVGIGVYSFFLDQGLVGTYQGLIFAHCILAVPFVVVAVSASLNSFDRRQEIAAVSLGATPVTCFFTVTLPQLVPGVLAGGTFAFVTSFDEILMSLFIQAPYLRTLPVQMYNSVNRQVDPTIAAASTLVVIVTAGLLLVGLVVLSRKGAKP